MAENVTLPALGESVTEGTVTQWLKQVGDTVEVDEPLLEISTDKVDTEIPSPVAGVLLEIKFDEDDTVEVGEVLAVIGEEGESAGESGGDDAASSEAEEPAEEEPEAEEPAEEESEEPAAEPDESAPAPQAESKPAGGSGGEAVTLPALGESVTEGTVTQWLKQVGDTVEVDEPLLEISTDKVDTEIPSPIAGTLLEIKVDEDETVEVGAELAVIGSGDAAESSSSEESQSSEQEESSAPAEEPEAEEQPEENPEPEAKPQAEPELEAKPEAEEPAQEQPEAEESSSSSGDEGYVTPIVRKLAKQHGVDLTSLTGSGVGGRIRKQDVLDAAKKAEQPEPAAASSAPSSSAPAPSTEVSALRGKTEKLSRLRKTIAKRLTESLEVSAQLTQVHEVDVTEVVRLRNQHKNSFGEREGVKLTFLPFFAKAAVEALKQYPQINASLDLEGGTITYPAGEHLGVAVDTERGLIVPVIKDAGDLSIAGLARKIADVADRTRTNKIAPDELSGGTFSLTNLGSNGALFDTPIINQPQSAILGVGAIVRRPVVMTDEHGNDSIAVRSMAYLALTYDHRIIDGADAGRFLTAVKQRLESAAFEGELG